MPDRLTLASLAHVPSDVAKPRYDPAGVTVGILHLGLGAFHRAHQAVYTDDVLASDPRWGICGVSLKTPRAIEPLAAQDGLYSYLERTSDGVGVRVIGAMTWNVVFMSIGGMAIYNLMMDRYGAAKAASGFFIVPGASALIAWLLIDEHLKPLALIGLAAATVGVALVWWKPRAI